MTYDPLKNLGAKLKLPSGWKYRVTVLQKDLRISTPQSARRTLRQGGFAAGRKAPAPLGGRSQTRRCLFYR